MKIKRNKKEIEKKNEDEKRTKRRRTKTKTTRSVLGGVLGGRARRPKERTVARDRDDLTGRDLPRETGSGRRGREVEGTVGGLVGVRGAGYEEGLAAGPLDNLLPLLLAKLRHDKRPHRLVDEPVHALCGRVCVLSFSSRPSSFSHLLLLHLNFFCSLSLSYDRDLCCCKRKWAAAWLQRCGRCG
jgi:hypothetical protein